MVTVSQFEMIPDGSAVDVDGRIHVAAIAENAIKRINPDSSPSPSTDQADSAIVCSRLSSFLLSTPLSTTCQRNERPILQTRADASRIGRMEKGS